MVCLRYAPATAIGLLPTTPRPLSVFRFHSRGDAMIARSRNTEMLLFKPVALDARSLKHSCPQAVANVDFRM